MGDNYVLAGPQHRCASCGRWGEKRHYLTLENVSAALGQDVADHFCELCIEVTPRLSELLKTQWGMRR